MDVVLQMATFATIYGLLKQDAQPITYTECEKDLEQTGAGTLRVSLRSIRTKLGNYEDTGPRFSIYPILAGDILDKMVS